MITSRSHIYIDIIDYMYAMYRLHIAVFIRWEIYCVDDNIDQVYIT